MSRSAQGTQILLADVVTYNQRTDTVTASGHVSLMTDDGEVVFADYMELRDSMNNAFAARCAHAAGRPLAARRQRGAADQRQPPRPAQGRLFAVRSVPSDPSQPPAWQLKARQITDDKDLQKLEFRDAVMEIDGWPVFYTPYIVTPDPSVKRASGFLMPTFGNSSTLGFHCRDALLPDAGTERRPDAIPALHHPGGTGPRAEYRQRFSNGEFIGIGSINYSNVGFAARPERSSTIGAATSTPPEFGISTTPTAPASSCSASPTRPTCRASAFPTPSSVPRSAAPISKAFRTTGRSTSTPMCSSR